MQGFLPAHGLHGLHGFLAAHGLQGLHGFFAAHGLQGLHGFFAAHGVQVASISGCGTAVGFVFTQSYEPARSAVGADSANMPPSTAL